MSPALTTVPITPFDPSGVHHSGSPVVAHRRRACRTRHDQLRRGPPGGAENHWCRETFGGRRAISLPAHAAGLPISRNDERSGPLVAEQDHQVVGDDRGPSHAIETGEGPEPQCPAVLAILRVRRQAEVREEGDHAVTVGHWCGRGGIIGVVDLCGWRVLISRRHNSRPVVASRLIVSSCSPCFAVNRGDRQRGPATIDRRGSPFSRGDFWSARKRPDIQLRYRRRSLGPRNCGHCADALAAPTMNRADDRTPTNRRTLLMVASSRAIYVWTAAT